VVVELVGERPGQARRHSTHDVVGHGGDGNAERGTHLARLSFSPKLNRSTSRILRMATRGLVNCCSSDGLSEEPAEQGLPRAAATSVPHRVYENVGIGVRIRSEGLAEITTRAQHVVPMLDLCSPGISMTVTTCWPALPKDLAEFNRWFDSEAAAARYLTAVRFAMVSPSSLRRPDC